MRTAGSFLLLLFAVSASGAVPDSERQALISLYDATAGDSWTNRTGWKGAAGTECTWFGVVCSNDTAVAFIQMPSNNLNGTLPALALPQLRELNLEKNHLSGNLPDLPVTVTGLLLKSNALTGEIPRSILNLTMLNNLTLEYNGLYSHDPQVQTFIENVEGPVLDFQTVAPTGLVAKPDNRSTITVSWTPVLRPTLTTHYDIYSGSSLLRSVSYDSNVATFGGLDSSKSYDFRIRTVADPHSNNTNRIESDASATINATPGPAPRTFDIGLPVLRQYWVDPLSGNDANNGTSSTAPFKTVDAALQAASSKTGYEIVLRPGDYPQGSFQSQIGGIGSQDAPVIVRAEIPGTARLHDFITASGSHIYLMGLTIDSQFGFAGGSSDYLLLRDVQVLGDFNTTGTSSHVYLENVDIESNAGATIAGVQYGHMTDSTVTSKVTGCLVVTAGSAYLTVDGNNVGPCAGAGITIGQVADLSRMKSPWLHYDVYDVKVTNNILHDSAIAVSGAYNVLFAHNTVVTSKAMQFISANLASRSCGSPSVCQTMHDAGGWGPTSSGSVHVPNRNVTISGNIFYSSVSMPQTVFVNAGSPDTTGSTAATNIPSPARTDDNLLVRGNLVWAPQAQILGTGGGCANSNSTCNGAQLQSDNSFNVVTPQFVDAAHGDYHPRANGNLFGLPAVTIAPFTWTDAPTQPPVPAGELVNTVTVDADGRARLNYVPGAFVNPAVPVKERAVKH